MSTAQQEKAPTPKELYDQQPDPLTPKPDEVERYMAAVQVRYESAKETKERQRLKREALNQIELAGLRASRRRDEALDSLSRMFRLGQVPSNALDGQFRGIFVTPAIHSLLDPELRIGAKLYMPWIGKRFRAADSGGENLLKSSVRPVASLLWPGYKQITVEDNGNLAGFRFKTHSGPGRLDPDRRTLTLDYDLEENPRFLVRNTLDELVEIVPGTYLGKMLYRRGGSWRMIGYFAVTDIA